MIRFKLTDIISHIMNNYIDKYPLKIMDKDTLKLAENYPFRFEVTHVPGET